MNVKGAPNKVDEPITPLNTNPITESQFNTLESDKGKDGKFIKFS